MDIKYAKTVLEAEADAIKTLSARLNREFQKAVRLILACKGRVVVSGMGKMGIIGEKISATLASTSTPSLFIHPAEAYHGDLGRIVRDDIVLLLSNSGETDEVIRLIPALKKIGTKIISLTRSAKSTLGKLSDVVLELGKIKEACPWDLVPTASTTAALALGDALALTIFRHRKLTREQYAFYHPGGELGRRLLKVKDIMHQGQDNPTVRADQTVKQALIVITRKRAGAVSVINKKGSLRGIFTDGDLRRHLERDPQILSRPIKEVMTLRPRTINQNALATEALHLLKDKKIDELPVVDDKYNVVGMLDIQDLLEVGLV